MNVFSDIVSGHIGTPHKKGQLVIVCTHATYSTYLLCSALRSKEFRVVFVPVSYSKNQKYVDAIKNEGNEIAEMDGLLDTIPVADLAIEDGARISKFIAKNRIHTKEGFFTIEQTSGGIRYLDLHTPQYPVIDVARSPLKLDIENRRATPEAVIQKYSEKTGQILGGKRVLIVGFGSIGEGLARLARVLGSRVTIYDTSQVRTVFARHRGYHIASNNTLNSILGEQDVIFMATNQYTGDLLDIRKILLLKDGAVIVNAGSGRGELDKRLWGPKESKVHDADISIKECDGHLIISSKKAGLKKKILVLGSGYPVNLHLGDGTSHDAIQFVMAMMFLAALDGPDGSSDGIQPLSSGIQEYIAASYIQMENTGPFEPTYVRTSEIDLNERLYGGIYPFHNNLNDKAHFAVVRAWFKTGTKTRGHYHLRSQEAYFVISGQAEIITWKYDMPDGPKSVHDMRKGDYLLVPEGYFHDVNVSTDEDFETLVISSPPFQAWDQFFEENSNE